MKTLSLYKILSFILLPIAVILGVFVIISIFISLANPALLIGTFMLACIVLYVFTSFRFLMRGVTEQQPCKPSLREWIKVNAYVSIVFCVMSLFQTIALLAQPSLITNVLSQQPELEAQLPENTSTDFLIRVMKITLYFTLALSVILLLHIILTFRLLKQFKHIFAAPQE
jgi:hypothetical protein